MIIGWWSAGITSAVAIHTALDHGLDVLPIYIETGSHHPDNERFKADCEAIYGRSILTARNPKYSSVLDLIDKTGYVNGVAGAECTRSLKKNVRIGLEKWLSYESQIFGFEYSPNEIKRAERFEEQYPDSRPIFPLIDAKLTKENCLYWLKEAGIEPPAMYSLGYRNNNCIGCVKGGMGYWNKIRADFPETFDATAKAERKAGYSCIKGVFLDELDPSRGRYPEELAPECGVYCQTEMMV